MSWQLEHLNHFASFSIWVKFQMSLLKQNGASSFIIRNFKKISLQSKIHYLQVILCDIDL